MKKMDISFCGQQTIWPQENQYPSALSVPIECNGDKLDIFIQTFINRQNFIEKWSLREHENLEFQPSRRSKQHHLSDKS